MYCLFLKNPSDLPFEVRCWIRVAQKWDLGVGKKNKRGGGESAVGDPSQGPSGGNEPVECFLPSTN